MNLYSRARRHIDMNRVKELREEKIKREKIAEVQKQQEELRVELKYINTEESKYIDWREELSEQMTSSAQQQENSNRGLTGYGKPCIINISTTQE